MFEIVYFIGGLIVLLIVGGALFIVKGVVNDLHKDRDVGRPGNLFRIAIDIVAVGFAIYFIVLFRII